VRRVIRAPHFVPALLFCLSLAGLVLSACQGPASLHPLVGRFAAEPTGSLLVTRDGNLWVIETGTPRQFTSGGTWRQARWSPDGRRFASVYRGDNFSELFVMNRDGSEAKRLTDSQSRVLQDSDWVFFPSWSPDGAAIAYVSDASSYFPALWTMQTDGSGRRQIVGTNQGLDGLEAPAWSPDGSTILFAGYQQGSTQLYRVLLKGTEVSAVTATSGGAFDPAWSPDGRLVAYAGREDGKTAVHVIHADGSHDSTVSQSGWVRAPTWSPDGRQLAFLSAATGHFEVYLVDLDTATQEVGGSNERQVTSDLSLDATSGLSWTP
jgi:TolB protein